MHWRIFEIVAQADEDRMSPYVLSPVSKNREREGLRSDKDAPRGYRVTNKPHPNLSGPRPWGYEGPSTPLQQSLMSRRLCLSGFTSRLGDDRPWHDRYHGWPDEGHWFPNQGLSGLSESGGLSSWRNPHRRDVVILARSHPDRPPSGTAALTRAILELGETENPGVLAAVLTGHQAERHKTENEAVQKPHRNPREIALSLATRLITKNPRQNRGFLFG